MREILFRGKRKDDGKWVEGHYHFANWYIPPSRDVVDTTYYILQIGHGDADEIDQETVGQFTGLTDKNGKKIFEGDIILFEDESPTNYEYHDSTEMRCGEIKFDDGQFYLTNRIAVEMEDLIYYGTLEGEVIGNIHDNPELLKEDYYE